MAELKSAADELSDELKEKVLLSILKKQLHQHVGDEVETSEDSVTTDQREVPAASRESADNLEALVPESEKTADTDSQDPPGSLGTSEENNADRDTVQEVPVTARTQGDLTVVDDQCQSTSEDQNTAESVDQAPPVPAKNEEKPDPIKQNEERLADEESHLSPDQLKERHETSQTLRARANNLYKESAFADAAVRYGEALQVCPLNEEKDRSILHANRAAALMAGHQNKEALPDLNRALELDPNYLKALERRARLNRMLENLDESLKDYEKLLELKPKHYAYIATIRELQEQIKKRDEELKAKMLDSLKQLGNVFLKPFGLSTENFSMVPSEGGGYSLQMKGQQ